MKVSVVMTTYNGEKYLKAQLDSIFSQILRPAEIIVSDDCSTDGTVAILEQYKHCEGFRYGINDQRLGLIRNFKKVVSMAAKGNYIALSDQDDIWLPDKLSRSKSLLDTLDSSKPCMVYTDLIWVDEELNVLNPSFHEERRQSGYHHNLQTLLYANFATGCTILLNPLLREYFLEMPDDIKFHDAWIALAASTFGQIGELTEPTIKYRRHTSNLSFTENTKRPNRYRQILNELLTSLKGDEDFLALQLETAHRFYNKYKSYMPIDIARDFQNFLQLEHKSYIAKKLAFRHIVRKFKK